MAQNPLILFNLKPALIEHTYNCLANLFFQTLYTEARMSFLFHNNSVRRDSYVNSSRLFYWLGVFRSEGFCHKGGRSDGIISRQQLALYNKSILVAGNPANSLGQVRQLGAVILPYKKKKNF